MNLIDLSVKKLSQSIRNNKVTSVDICKAFIKQIKKKESKVKAWEYFNEKKILKEARKLDKKKKILKTIGPLYGIPVALKDIISTSDMPTKFGTRIKIKDYKKLDAQIVKILKQAGAIIMGKTVTCELAFLSPSITKNPIDLSRTPGGSSSGSAAVIAAKMAPLSIGTQTGGSVIRPASFCGVVGYKPSYGLISTNGILKTSYHLDQVGVFGNSVEDVKILSEILFSKDKLTKKKHYPKKTRFVFFKTDRWRNVDKLSRLSFENFIKKNKKIIKVLKAPNYFEKIIYFHTIIYETELAENFYHLYISSKLKLSKEMKSAISNGLKHTAKDYAIALNYLRTVEKKFDKIFSDFDGILTPSSCGVANKGFKTTGSPEFNKIWTFAHMPCISLPILHGEKNLPLGLQLICKKKDDRKLLELSNTLNKM